MLKLTSVVFFFFVIVRNFFTHAQLKYNCGKKKKYDVIKKKHEKVTLKYTYKKKLWKCIHLYIHPTNFYFHREIK